MPEEEGGKNALKPMKVELIQFSLEKDGVPGLSRPDA